MRSRGCGCGGCLTAVIFVAMLGALWTYVLTGNGRWVALGVVGFAVVYRVARTARRRGAAKRGKTADIAKGAVWAAQRGLLPPEDEDVRTP